MTFIYRYKWESAKTLKTIRSFNMAKVWDEQHTSGTLLTLASGTRRVR